MQSAQGEQVSGASARREAGRQTLEPTGLAGCYTTLQAAYIRTILCCGGKGLLASCHQQRTAAAGANDLTGFVESWVGGRPMGGRGLST